MLQNFTSLLGIKIALCNWGVQWNLVSPAAYSFLSMRQAAYVYKPNYSLPFQLQ